MASSPFKKPAVRHIGRLFFFSKIKKGSHRRLPFSNQIDDGYLISSLALSTAEAASGL